MQYKPTHGAMKVIYREPFLERYTVVICTELEQVGAIKYEHLLVVLDNDARAPVYYVTSEVNASAGQFGGGSHALCVFDGSGHGNMGFSDDWASLEAFVPAAFGLVQKRFGAAAPG